MSGQPKRGAGRPAHPDAELVTVLAAFLSAKAATGIGKEKWCEQERGADQRQRLQKHLERGQRTHARLPQWRRAAADERLKRSLLLYSAAPSDALLSRLKTAWRRYKTDGSFKASVDAERELWDAFAPTRGGKR
jgi:hypothetical protein